MTHHAGAPEWEVIADRTAPSKKGYVVGQTSKDQTDGRFPLLIYDNSNLKDGEISVAFKAVSGSGEASTQTASVAGFGSQASYDGTLGDTALRNAVSEIVNKMSNELLSRPWQTSILQRQGDRIFISGGKSQGLKPGMTLAVETRGERVKSPQTGFTVTLPGQEVAKIKVESSFGDNETNEGSVATLVSGKLDGYKIETLTVVSKE